MHLRNVVPSDECEEHREQHSSGKRGGASEAQPVRCGIVTAEKKLHGIGERIANIRTHRGQRKPRKDVRVMDRVRVSDPVERVGKPKAQECRQHEREIIDDASTLPIPDCCVFERMEVTHDGVSVNDQLTDGGPLGESGLSDGDAGPPFGVAPCSPFPATEGTPFSIATT